MVVSRVMCQWMGPWGSSLGWHCGQGSGTAGRGPAQHPGLFPPSLRVFRLAVREPLAHRIPRWICLGSQHRSIRVCWSVQHHQRVGVSSSGPHCPPHLSGIRVDVSARGAVRQKIGDLGKPLWCGEKGLWEGVTCPQKVPSPVILTCGFVDMLETPGRPRKDGGFGICCRPLLCRQPGDGQGIVIPECWSVFLQQSHSHCRVPGSTGGRCKVLGILLPPFTAQIPGTGRDQDRKSVV